MDKAMIGYSCLCFASPEIYLFSIDIIDTSHHTFDFRFAANRPASSAESNDRLRRPPLMNPRPDFSDSYHVTKYIDFSRFEVAVHGLGGGIARPEGRAWIEIRAAFYLAILTAPNSDQS